MDYLRGLIGIAVLITIAYLFSSYRKKIDWKLVATGIALQIIIGLLILKVPFVRNAFEVVGAGFVTFLGFAAKGAEFLFGDLAKNSSVDGSAKHNLGFLFAFQ